MKFRSELKQYINYEDYMVLKPRLTAVARPDPHAGPTGKYKIRSLYFETPDNRALREKLEGVAFREKFRIRCYNDDYSFLRLEKKTKACGYGNKLSAPLTREECEKIIAGDIDFMRQSGRAIMIELYCKMKGELWRPATIVDYEREPYIFRPGNVRITIDSNIRTGIHSRDFFNPELPSLSPLASDPIILEIKYDEYLPDIIRDIVQLGNRKSTAFSKYAVCRMFG